MTKKRGPSGFPGHIEAHRMYSNRSTDVRPFNPERDKAAVTALYKEAYRGPPWKERWSNVAVERHLDSIKSKRGNVLLVAVQVDEDTGVKTIAGFVAGHPVDEGVLEKYPEIIDILPKNTFFIRELCVSPNMQREGIGRLLHNALVRRVRQMHPEAYFATTIRGAYSVPLFVKRGFRPLKEPAGKLVGREIAAGDRLFLVKPIRKGAVPKKRLGSPRHLF